MVGMVLIDLRKAFDTVDGEILLQWELLPWIGLETLDHICLIGNNAH